MKKIFSLITMPFYTVATFAAWGDARLCSTSMRNAPVRIMINGRQVHQGN